MIDSHIDMFLEIIFSNTCLHLIKKKKFQTEKNIFLFFFFLVILKLL